MLIISTESQADEDRKSKRKWTSPFELAPEYRFPPTPNRATVHQVDPALGVPQSDDSQGETQLDMIGQEECELFALLSLFFEH